MYGTTRIGRGGGGGGAEVRVTEEKRLFEGGEGRGV